MKNIQTVLATSLLILLSACSTAKLIRENDSGPNFTTKKVPVVLASQLDTNLAEGPVRMKAFQNMKLSDGTVLVKNTEISGYYITKGNRVLWAPSQADVTKDGKPDVVLLNSNQTGQIELTPSSARYLKEAGKGAAVGAGVGALAGGMIGSGHGLGGVLIGAGVGAVAGGAIGAGSSATGLWLRGDKPVQLPAGTGIIINMGAEE